MGRYRRNRKNGGTFRVMDEGRALSDSNEAIAGDSDHLLNNESVLKNEKVLKGIAKNLE